jgi:putative flippase GtrA
MVGAVSYAVNAVVLVLCVEWLRLHYVAAMVVNLIVVVLVAHFLHRRITFKSRRSYLRELGRYNVITSSQFVLCLLMMSFFIEVVHLPYLLANALSAILLAFASFLAHRAWTFADRPLEDD